jgi:hypothetical protein
LKLSFLKLHSLIWVHLILPELGEISSSMKKPFEFEFVEIDFIKLEFALV